MFRKLIAIVVAVLINCAVLVWFHAWTSAMVANASPLPEPARKVLMLPTINVYPSAGQLRALRRERLKRLSPQADVSRG